MYKTSADDLENIYSLVKEAKAKGPLTALRVVNKMIMKDFFLYGSVTTNQKKMREAIDTLSSKAAERVQLARKRQGLSLTKMCLCLFLQG